MDRKPREERENAGHRPVLAAEFRNGGVAANHRHDTAIDVREWLSRFSGDVGQDVIGAVPARLLRNGSELGQWPSVDTRRVCEVAEHVYAGMAGEREIRLDIDAATSTRLYPERT